MIALSNPPDLFLKLLSDLKDIYCENDFLLDSKAVVVLSYKYQELTRVMAILDGYGDEYQEKIACDYNGYKTLASVSHCLVVAGTERGQSILAGVGNLNTVKHFLATWTERFSRMTDILNIAAGIRDLNTDHTLFPQLPDSSEAKVMEISRRIINLDVSPFYGEIQSFYLKEDINIFTAVLHKAMVFYYFYDKYQWKNWAKASKDYLETVQCLFDDELRSKKVVQTSKEMGVDFAKKFFQMGESLLPKSMKKLVLPKVKTSLFIQIPLSEPVEAARTNDEAPLVVFPPSSPVLKNSMRARLIADYRIDRSPACSCQVSCTCSLEESGEAEREVRDTIMIHLHGGGWVAQSPESHLDYLHQWATQLDTPILSLDYSLAPEAPYPRACEEVFYSYVWILRNLETLGTTGKKILVCGDSCGGNLATGLVLRCIANNIRVPDGLHISYANLLTQFFPSPSRLMMLIDPVLMVGILGKCINAYKDNNYINSLPRTLDQELSLATSENDIFLSPMLADETLLKRFPPTLIIETDVDACLDENVQFYSKLVKAGVTAKFSVIPGLPHGFLSFCNLSEVCQAGVSQVISQMRELISQI